MNKKIDIQYYNDNLESCITNQDYAIAAVLYWINEPNICYLSIFPTLSGHNSIRLYEYQNKECPILCKCIPYDITDINVLSKTFRGPVITTLEYAEAMYSISKILIHRQWNLLSDTHPNIRYFMMLTVLEEYKNMYENYGCTFVEECVLKCSLCTGTVCLNELEYGIQCKNRKVYLFGFEFSECPDNITTHRACALSKLIDSHSVVPYEVLKEGFSFTFNPLVNDFNNGSLYMRTLVYIHNEMKSICYWMNFKGLFHIFNGKIIQDFILMLICIKKRKNILKEPIFMFPTGMVLVSDILKCFINDIARCLQLYDTLPMNLFKPENAMIEDICTRGVTCPKITRIIEPLYKNLKSNEGSMSFPNGLPDVMYIINGLENHTLFSRNVLCPNCLDESCDNIISDYITLRCGHTICNTCWIYNCNVKPILCPICNADLQMLIPTLTDVVNEDICYLAVTDVCHVDSIIYSYYNTKHTIKKKYCEKCVVVDK